MSNINSFKIMFAIPPINNTTLYGKKLLFFNAPGLAIGYLKSFLQKYNIPSVYHDFYFDTWDIVEKTLRKENPQVLALSCLTEGRNSVYKLIKIAKKINPNVIVVLGGHHVT